MKRSIGALLVLSCVAVTAPASAGRFMSWPFNIADTPISRGQTLVLQSNDNVLQDTMLKSTFTLDRLPDKGNLRVGFETRVSGRSKIGIRASVAPNGSVTAQVLDAQGKVMKEVPTKVRLTNNLPQLSLQSTIIGAERGQISVKVSGPTTDITDNMPKDPQIVLNNVDLGSQTGTTRSVAYLSRDAGKSLLIHSNVAWNGPAARPAVGQTVRFNPSARVLGSRTLAGTFDQGPGNKLLDGSSLGLMSHIQGPTNVQARVTTIDEHGTLQLQIVDAAGKIVATAPATGPRTNYSDRFDIEAEFIGTNTGTVRMRSWRQNESKPDWQLSAQNVSFGSATGTSAMFFTVGKKPSAMTARAFTVIAR